MLKVGDRFGRLVITKYENCFKITVRCDCGVEKMISSSSNLISGRTTSCGCLCKEVSRDIGRKNVRHGMARKAREWTIWQGMNARCRGNNEKAIKYYKVRGIEVCETWRDSFEAFYRDMGPCPSPNHTLERVDGSKGYSPDNCRWATKKEQGRNKRNNRVITYNGKSQPMSAWAEELGINYATLKTRLNKLKWPVERALTSDPK
jgi:hypothetical protein